jgi:hypothetical protein
MEPELKSPSTGNNENIDSVEQFTKFLALATTGAAAVAVAFDVGYFWGLDINMFTIFSISEHILFSFEALPLAAGCLFSLVIIRSMVPVLSNKLIMPFIDSHNEVSSRRRRAQTLVILLIMLLIITIIILTLYINKLYIIFLFQPILFLILLINVNKIENKLYIIEYMFIYTTFFIFSCIQGAIIAQRYTAYDAEALHKITTNDHITLDGRLIRSGEKGVLFFDTEKKQVVFLRWETIDSIRDLPRPWEPYHVH